MNLEDYPTPLTDAEESIDNGETGPLLDFARDLERKLAMCREFIHGLSLGFRVIGNQIASSECSRILEQTK